MNATQRFATFLLSFFILCALSFSTVAQTKDYEVGQLFVQFDAWHASDLSWSKNGTTQPLDILTRWIEQFELTTVSRPFFLENEALQRTYLFEFEASDRTAEFIAALESFQGVVYAERVPVHDFFYTPNDPQLNNQWHLQTIQAFQAWDVITTQTSNVVIAIVDDAVLLSHEDLQTSIWTNPGEIAGDLIDNDGNGYVDDVNGWDAADNDNNANPDNPTNSFFTHGTHCAGIAAARTDNNLGIASLGYNAWIMPVKTSTLPNPGSVIAGYAGVQYAIINGADVISMSWGGSGYSATYQLIFDQAYAAGIVCIAAAGNSNTSAPMYPASYNHVISVAASDQNDLKAGFSNYGAAVDITAPGVAIYSSLAGSNNSYGSMQGTSMACPMVAGLAAMLIACEPTLPPDQVEDCIKSSSDDIYPQNATYLNQLGAGRINAANAVACVKQIVARFESDYPFACPDQTLQFTDMSTGTPISWNWSFPGGNPATSTLQNPSVSYSTPGNYPVTLIVSDGTSTDTLTQTSYITVATPQATLSGGSTIIAGYTGYLTFNFTGNAPWSVTYFDGTSNVTASGILNSPYYLPVTPQVTTTYSLVSFSDAGCAGTTSGLATINVSPPSGSSECYYSKYFGDAGDQQFDEFYYDIVNDAVFAAGRHVSSPLYAGFNAAGDLLFSVTLQGVSGSFTDIVSAPNGDKLCLSNDNEDIVIARFTDTGTLLWVKRYNNLRERSPDLIASVGDTYIVGTWYSTGGSSDDFAIMRIDGSGNILWSTKFHNTDDQMYEMVPNGNGGAVFCGGLHGGGTIDMFIGEIDLDGNFGTVAEYNNSGFVMNESNQLIKTMNNEYVTASRANSTNTNPSDANLLRMDANLDPIWEVSFTFPGGRINYIDGLEEDSDGNIYVSCRYNDGSPDLGAVLKFDPSGNLLWSKQLTGTRALVMHNTNSSPVDNLIFTRIYDGSNFGGTDCFLARTDTSLNSCIAAPVTTTLLSGVSTRTNLAISVSPLNYTVTTLTPTVVPLNYQNAVLCEDCDQDTSCLNQVNAAFTANTVCLGDTTFFTNQSTAAAGTINSWIWDFGDGSQVFGTANPYHVYQNPGTYAVTLTVTNDSVPMCEDQITQNIVVVDQPFLQMPPDQTICLGDSVVFNNVSILCASPVGWNYSWTPATSINDPTLQQPTAAPSSTITYTLTATNGGMTLAGTVTITVDVNCCASHAAFQPNTNWCEGDMITLTNTSLSSGNADFEWNFGSAAIPSSFSGATPPPINFTGTGVFPVSLILTDDCGIDTLATDILILPAPIANAGPDKFICAPTTIGIGDTTIAWYAYDWIPAGLVNQSDIANPIATVPGDTMFIVTVTDNWTGCSASDTVLVTILPPLSASLQDQTLCSGATLVLDASGVGSSWLWQNGDTLPTLAVTSGGIYTVLISDQCNSYEDTIFVAEMNCSCTLDIPNVFSPNIDGINDLFIPTSHGLCDEGFSMVIVNRWGNVIWQVENKAIVGWDGTTNSGARVTEGTYFYLIEWNGEVYQGYFNVVR